MLTQAQDRIAELRGITLPNGVLKVDADALLAALPALLDIAQAAIAFVAYCPKCDGEGARLSVPKKRDLLLGPCPACAPRHARSSRSQARAAPHC